MTQFSDLVAFEIDESEPLAILADIHANLEALGTVTSWLDARGVSAALVLGDLIGYGASPGPCVRLVRSRGWHAIRGNHEDMLIDLSHVERTRSLKPSARKALAWTRSHLDETDLEFVANLPLAARVGSGILAVHGSLVDPRHCYAYIYEFSLSPNAERLKEFEPPAGTLLCFGHTHQRAVFRVEPDGCCALEVGQTPIDLDSGKLHLVNPGSVGFSRDGDPRAAFMLYHPARRKLEPVRLEYDVESAAEKIRSAGYEETLADRLLAAR